MNLTVYLLRETISELDQIPLEEGYSLIEPSTELPFPCLALIQANRPKPPSWTPWLETAFDMEPFKLRNQSNSFVLFLQVDKRIFATTFGYGFNAIDRALIEPDFGLKVTLNEVDPNGLDMLDTRRVDRISRQKKTHLNVARGVADFDISTDMDWIRRVSGRALSPEFTRKLVGADSLKLSMDCAVSELGNQCRELLKRYRKKQYKKHFGFIDHLRPLKPKDPLLGLLEEKLVELLEARDVEWVSIALPEIPDHQLASWRVSQGHRGKHYEDLDIGNVYDFLDTTLSGPVSPEKIRIMGLDAEGIPQTHRERLHQYLVAQVDLDDATYILSLGHWFRVDKDYIARMRAQVRQLPDVTDTLQLPEWTHSIKKEGDYNRHVGEEKSWLVLDAKSFHVEGRDGKLEACDLLSRDRDFLHVKDMKDSATLSHLFSQGSVSATLFKSETAYAEEVKKRFQDFYGDKRPFDNVKKGPRVVYAIATTKPGALADTLFFFSIINLLQHIETVRVAGFEVALCKIERSVTL